MTHEPESALEHSLIKQLCDLGYKLISIGHQLYNYFIDISKRMKNHAKYSRHQQIDVLLVVNMFLTGFDSKTINTLYVDKNLQHHGLIQAYSRTNRVFGETKSQGNVVVFRNLKQATDEAIALFSNKNAKEIIL